MTEQERKEMKELIKECIREVLNEGVEIRVDNKGIEIQPPPDPPKARIIKYE